MVAGIAVATVLAATMLIAVFATTQTVYAQIESSGDVQDSSGDETITDQTVLQTSQLRKPM
ncbi:MAG: hypothetical protein WAL24_10810 [Nitrososphaeraceae archaeon]